MVLGSSRECVFAVLSSSTSSPSSRQWQQARGEDDVDEREARRRRKAVAQARRRTEGSEHSGERRAQRRARMERGHAQIAAERERLDVQALTGEAEAERCDSAEMAAALASEEGDLQASSTRSS